MHLSIHLSANASAHPSSHPSVYAHGARPSTQLSALVVMDASPQSSAYPSIRTPTSPIYRCITLVHLTLELCGRRIHYPPQPEIIHYAVPSNAYLTPSPAQAILNVVTSSPLGGSFNQLPRYIRGWRSSPVSPHHCGQRRAEHGRRPLHSRPNQVHAHKHTTQLAGRPLERDLPWSLWHAWARAAVGGAGSRRGRGVERVRRKAYGR